MSDWTSITTAVQEAYTDTEQLSYDGTNSSSVTLRCPWADRYNVANDVVNRIWPYLGGGRLAGKISIKAAPNTAHTVDAGGKLQYEDALVTISYDVADLGSLEQTIDPVSGKTVLYREQLVPYVEHQKLDHSLFCWGTNSLGRVLTEAESPFRQTRGYALSRTIYNLPQIDPSILTLPGYVNNATYTSASLGLTFPVETLLFGDPSMDRSISAAGAGQWTLNIKYPYREMGWNKFWRVDKLPATAPKWDTIWDTENNVQYRNFPLGSFANWLF